MNKYIKQLEGSYQGSLDDNIPPTSKLEFIATDVFNLLTYDSGEDSKKVLFANNILEVCKVIIERRNFDYIEDEDNYTKYLLMINMGFFDNILDWGTSIRGAWFDNDVEIEHDCGRILVEKHEYAIFIKQMFKWLGIKLNIKK